MGGGADYRGNSSSTLPEIAVEGFTIEASELGRAEDGGADYSRWPRSGPRWDTWYFNLRVFVHPER
jgi:hypothetical protein